LCVRWRGWAGRILPIAPRHVGTFAQKEVTVDGAESSGPLLALAKTRDNDDRVILPEMGPKKTTAPLEGRRGRAIERMGKPMPSRSVESRVEPSYHLDAVLTPMVAAKKDALAETDPPMEVASVELHLAGNKLNVAELQQAEMSEWSNRIVVESPRSSDVVQLAHFIRANMALNDIPHLTSIDVADTIASQASFYSFKADDSDDLSQVDADSASEARRGESDAVTPTVVVHVPRAEAEQLIASMQTWAVGNNVDASWTFNARPVSQDAVAGEVAPQLAASDVLPSGWSAMRAFGDNEAGTEVDVDAEEESDGLAAKESPEEANTESSPSQPTARGSAPKKTVRAEVKREQHEDEEAEEKADENSQAGSAQPNGKAPVRAAPGTQVGRRAGRLTSPGSNPTGKTVSGDVAAGVRPGWSSTQPGSSASGDSRFVTLAIALRSVGAAATAPAVKMKKRRATPASQTTPAASFMGPPAPTSQPTTQESTGG